jgi:hypothetical protein
MVQGVADWFRQSATSPPPQSDLMFARLTLFSGRPMYWALGGSPAAFQNAIGLGDLIERCCAWPGVHVGIEPTAVAMIVRSVIAEQDPNSSAAILAWLEEEGVSEAELEGWLTAVGVDPDQALWLPGDAERFGVPNRIRWLLGLLRDAAPSGGGAVIWIDQDAAVWWTAETKAALIRCALRWDSISNDTENLLPIFSRHQCVFFSTEFDPSVVPALAAGRPDSPSPPTCWSWRLLDFRHSGGNLLHTPLLALWSERPADPNWAPPATRLPLRRPFRSPGPFGAEAAARYLKQALWERIASGFGQLCKDLNLSEASPSVGTFPCRSPVFFFAQPADPPTRVDAYASDHLRSVYPIVKTCLEADDPLSNGVAWGVLEGDLVALRREVITRTGVQARYILLPVAVKTLTQEDLERDLAQMARTLMFLEFSIADEADNVEIARAPIAARMALIGGLLDSVTEVLGGGIQLTDASSEFERERVYGELRRLLVTLRRLQASLEKDSSDAEQVQRQFRSYQDGTEDFLRRNLTISSIALPHLTDLWGAMLDAYPYHYLNEPLKSLKGVSARRFSTRPIDEAVTANPIAPACKPSSSPFLRR